MQVGNGHGGAELRRALLPLPLWGMFMGKLTETALHTLLVAPPVPPFIKGARQQQIKSPSERLKQAATLRMRRTGSNGVRRTRVRLTLRNGVRRTGSDSPSERLTQTYRNTQTYRHTSSTEGRRGAGGP